MSFLEEIKVKNKELKNMKSGSHSFTVKKDKIEVFTSTGKGNFVGGIYRLEEYEKAIAAYNRLIESDKQF